MKKTLKVETGNYNIIISDDKFSKFVEEINTLTFGRKRLFIVSEKVFNLYAEVLCLNPEEVFVLKDGENQKNFKNYTKILRKASDIGLTRSDVLIAIGGGVVGDITGFVASSYMRGIDFIQIPTTLLSMIDSSVGGKTAINFNGIKNVVGSFYQPKEVLINLNFLGTLDKRQYLSGIGEILKYAFIEKSCNIKNEIYFFEYLNLCCDKLLKKDSMTLFRVIEYCLSLKKSVVNRDEKERSLRRVLNFGHTLGHALEELSWFKKITHGEAVVQGMFFAFNNAYSQGLIPYSYYKLSIDLLNKYGFKSLTIKHSADKLISFMLKDKKVQNNNIVFVMPTEKKEVSMIEYTIDEVKNFIK